MPYIYKLSDPRSPTIIRYVGKTSGRLIDRLADHIRDCRRQITNTHKTRWIRSLLADGIKPVIAPILHWHDHSSIDWEAIERVYIDMVWRLGHPLTNTQAGGSGLSHTPEICEKIRQTLTGHKRSLESRERQSALSKGNKKPEGFGAKIAAAWAAKKALIPKKPDTAPKPPMKGRKKPEGFGAKISAAHKGRTLSPARVEKMRLYRATPETKAKLSASCIGRKVTTETRAKISTFQKGRKKSPETLAKMREAALRRHAREREVKS